MRWARGQAVDAAFEVVELGFERAGEAVDSGADDPIRRGEQGPWMLAIRRWKPGWRLRFLAIWVDSNAITASVKTELSTRDQNL